MRGVRWFIRYVEDKSSKNRVIRGSQDAARKSGSTWRREAKETSSHWYSRMRDSFKRTEKQSQQSAGIVRRTWTGLMNYLKTPMGRFSALLGGVFSVYKIQAFGRDSIRMFAAQEAIWNRLGGQLEALGLNYQALEADIRASARTMQDFTRLGDEEFANILLELISVSSDYAASMNEVETVLNLATAKQMDYASAAKLVGRAMIGDTMLLKRYGIIVEEGGDAMAVLRAQFAGMAANEVRSLSGQVNQVTNEWGDYKEAIGGVLAASGNAAGLLETLRATFKGWTIYIEENQDRLVGWGRVTITTIMAVVRTITNSVRVIKNGFTSALNLLDLISSQMTARIGETLNEWLSGWNNIFYEIDRLAQKVGKSFDFRFEMVEVEKYTNRAADAMDRIVQDSDDIGESLGNIVNAWDEVLLSVRQVGQAQAKLNVGGGGVPGGDNLSPEEIAERQSEIELLIKAHELGILRGDEEQRIFELEQQLTAEYRRGNLTLAERIDALTRLRQISGVAGQLRQESPLAAIGDISMTPIQAGKRTTFDEDSPTFQTMVEQARETSANMESAFTGAAFNITDAFSNAFGLIGKEGENLGSFMMTIAKGIASALVGGVAQYAGVKVGENIASAFENFAKAKAAAALGPIGIGPAGLFAAAAKGHLVSAAKWGALASVASAGAGAIGGGSGGGSGGYGSSRRPGDRDLFPDHQNQGNRPVVFIGIDPFDPSSPIHMRQIAVANQFIEENFGAMKVSAHVAPNASKTMVVQ